MIITGGYLQQQIHDAYAFINGLFKKHFHQIIKLSILDFKKDDDSIETPVDQSINNLTISLTLIIMLGMHTSYTSNSN